MKYFDLNSQKGLFSCYITSFVKSYYYLPINKEIFFHFTSASLGLITINHFLFVLFFYHHLNEKYSFLKIKQSFLRQINYLIKFPITYTINSKSIF